MTPLICNLLAKASIIRSLLETDLYKFSMWQTMLHKHPETQAEYRFVCRSTPEYPLAELRDDVNAELDALCKLTFAADELDYLRERSYLKSDFIDFLSIFRLQRRFITVSAVGGVLQVVAKGPQVHVMPFEIYVLEIVNELYYRRLGKTEERLAEGRARLAAKIDLLKDFLATEPARKHPFEFSDFGGRRRYSAEWHEEVVQTLVDAFPDNFKGTSNVYLAKKLGLIPIGTMAHEYLQTYQAVGVQLKQFQRAALEDWVQEYRGSLGIALTDVVGMDAFLADFDLYFAKLFDGLRHDSGCPFGWGEKALAHYGKLKIDANTKRLVFSDGLNFERAIELYRAFADRVQVAFGIGTNLTNDTGVAALQIVMKLVRCNGLPVAKLPDTPGKTLCDDQPFLDYLTQLFRPAVAA